MGLKEVFGRYRKSVYVTVLLVLVAALAFLLYDNYILMHCQPDFPYSTKVYDLIWTEKTTQGEKVCHKWRCFLCPDSSYRPIVIEKYSRHAPGDYKLEGTLTIKSSIEQIKSAVKDAGFGDLPE